MFNIFKSGKDERKFNSQPAVIVSEKTEEQLIQEIHDSIDSAQDRLLKEAVEIIEKHKISDEKRIKAENLRRLGFVQTKEVSELNENDRKTQESKQNAENIIYYKQKYPFLKFITRKELDAICDKYGLMYSSVNNYIGAVPDRNLIDICNAQRLQPEDFPNPGNPARFKNKKTNQIAHFHFTWEIYEDNPLILNDEIIQEDWEYEKGQTWASPARDSGLLIAAPKSMFNTKNLEVRGNELVTKDPIVFRYVRGGIQVITKWGLEASDPILINPVNN